MKELDDLGAEGALRSHVVQLILATKNHSAGGRDYDDDIFLDADFSILGAPDAAYRQYVGDVRAEYAHVDDAGWKTGRSAFLKKTLAARASSAPASSKANTRDQARKNIAWELQRIGQGRGQSADAQTHRHRHDPDHRRRPHRHRPGVRVRLLGRPSLPRAPRRGLSHRPREFESGDDHDGPGTRGRDLHRTDHAGVRDQNHRPRTQGTPARPHGAAAHDGRPDRAELRARSAQSRHAEKIRRRDDRRPARSDRQSRRPPAVPRGDGKDRPRMPALAHRDDEGRSAGGNRSRRPARDHPPLVHAGRPRRRHRLQPAKNSSRSSNAASTPRRSNPS